MAHITIQYNEPNPNEYYGVELSYAKGKILYDSGDFVKDWFDCLKFIILSDLNEPISHSSSVNHFIMDGAPFDSAYLVTDHDGNSRLYVADRTDEHWYLKIPKGIEFFIKDGTSPTWEELKKYCGHENINGQ